MKIIKRILLLLVLIIVITVIYNYPKLNLLSGFAAKSVASSVYLADRTLALTDSTDNNFSPVNLAKNSLDRDNNLAVSSTFGILTRKAVYREGVGAVLAIDDEDITALYLVPKRSKPNNDVVFPYGNADQRDTVFANVDYENLDTVVENLIDTDQTRSVLVIYKDQIIAEEYDVTFDKYSKFLGWSMTKSLMSTVFGILQNQGKINVRDKAPIASWQNDERKNITIHNLLQMNSGLEWEEDYTTISDVTKMLFLEKDMTKAQEHKELIGKPNESWKYSSGTSNLLEGIIRQQFTSHQKYLDFWYSDFIDKIAMNSMIVETDLAGNYVTSSYAWATTRDWAKFGLLYLHEGNWNGMQLFNKNWVEYVTQPTPTSNGRYGAQFWLNAKGKFASLPKNMFYADGYQGQRIYVLPDQELVVVRFGLENFDEEKFLKGVLESIDFERDIN